MESIKIDTEPKIELISDTREVEQIASKLDSMPLVAVDTETEGLDPYKHKVLLF